MKHCKHNLGWVCSRNVNIFIYEDGKITFDFQGRTRKSYKIKMKCNIVECSAERNVFIEGKLIKWEKIIKRGGKK